MPRRTATKAQLRAQELVGSRVRELRTALGISQEDLAHRCGVHRTFVGHVERGEVNPTLGTLVVVAQGLGVSLTQLVEGL